MKFLFLLFAFTQIAIGEQQTLINGKPVPAGEYLDVVYVSVSGSRCTATLVSDRTVITAAHCVRTGGKLTFSVLQNQYSAVCTRSPIYPRKDHDIALCKTDRAVTGMKPRNVGTEKVKVGSTVTLLGFGCRRSGGGGGNDGTLYFGDAQVLSFSNLDIVSGKGAALCFGDSGGPMMQHGNIIGVNSKGNISDTSYNADLSLEQSVSFMKKFAEDNSVEICGVTSECSPPKPKNPCLEENAVVKYFEIELAQSKEPLKLCEAN